MDSLAHSPASRITTLLAEPGGHERVIATPLRERAADVSSIGDHGPTSAVCVALTDTDTRSPGVVGRGATEPEARANADETYLRRLILAGEVDLEPNEHDVGPLLEQWKHGGVVRIEGPTPLVEAVIRALSIWGGQ